MDTQDLQRLKNKFDIIGNDAALNRAIEMAVAVAPTDLTVLVTGESGVGKENIPKIIHQFSRRKTAKYFAVNCGAIPEGTVDSELFGHEKGSFTGAIEARKGYFEEADGGTLFLDEVGELPMASQAKLLRVLQSGEYMRVGSSRVDKTDVRVIAATNVDLLYAVSQGKFREDLYYRLNAVQIKMPALRERKDDIYLLFRKFASDFSEKYQKNKINLSHEAIERLQDYRWPGNVRQLKNIAERVAAFESADILPGASRIEISAATLDKYMPHDDPHALLPAMFHDPGKAISGDEKQEIFKALYALKSEIDSLRKEVDTLKGGQVRAIAAPQEVSLPAATERLAPQTTQYPQQGSGFSQQGSGFSQQGGQFPQHPQQEADYQDVDEQIPSAREPEQSLSIKGANDDLIRRALEKYNGNRKKAAEELGISERTLYRKLPPEFRTQRKK
jgi:DNA-binding NtrC family response regulator